MNRADERRTMGLRRSWPPRSLWIGLAVAALVLVFPPRSAHGDECGARYFFINGLLNQPAVAASYAEEVATILQTPVTLLYQENDNVLEDLGEVARQHAAADPTPEESSAYWSDIVRSLLTEGFAESVDAAINERTREVLMSQVRRQRERPIEELFEENADLREQVNRHYRPVMDDDKSGRRTPKKVVTVSHSQGTLFAVNAWQVFDQVLDRPRYRDGFGGVLLGTPSPILPPTFRYTTNENDVVVEFVRAQLGQVLPPNIKISSSSDLMGHSFLGTYVRNQELRDRLEHQVQQVLSDLDCPPHEEDGDSSNPGGGGPGGEPVACGSKVRAEGGSGVHRRTVKLGSYGGEVQLNFEPYHIRDGIEVVGAGGDGRTLASSSGKVRGFRRYEFQHRPDRNGRNVEVVVRGNRDDDTRWYYVLGCPDQSLSDPRVNVGFYFGPAEGNIGGIRCSFDVDIDGETVAHAREATRYRFSQDLSPGRHEIAYRNASCQTLQTRPDAPTIMEYYDSTNRHAGVGRGTSLPIPDHNTSRTFVVE